VKDFERDRWGRPLIVPPNAKGKPVAYSRCSSFGAVLEDRFNLELWKVRTACIGLAQQPHLLAQVAACKVDDSKTLNRLAEEALNFGGSRTGAGLGTALHQFAERVDVGELSVDAVIDPWGADVRAYLAALDAHGLSVVHELTEVALVHDELRVAGTADRFYRRDDGRLVCADLKTGKKIGDSPLAYVVQLAAYATALRYDVERGVRSPVGDVDTSTGLLVHLPAGKAMCTIYEVDLVAGMELARLAGRVRAAQKRKDLVRQSLPGHYPGATFGEAGPGCDRYGSIPGPDDVRDQTEPTGKAVDLEAVLEASLISVSASKLDARPTLADDPFDVLDGKGTKREPTSTDDPFVGLDGNGTRRAPAPAGDPFVGLDGGPVPAISAPAVHNGTAQLLARVTWVRDRIIALRDMGAPITWPEGLVTPKAALAGAPVTDDDVEAMCRVVSEAEAAVRAPFPATDDPAKPDPEWPLTTCAAVNGSCSDRRCPNQWEAVPGCELKPKRPAPPAKPDEGASLTASEYDELKAWVAEHTRDPEVAALVNRTAGEGGRALVVPAWPSVRRRTLAMALVRLAGHGEEVLRAACALVLSPAEDEPLGCVLAAMTIDQASVLLGIAEQVDTNQLALGFTEDGTAVLSAAA